MNIDEQIKKRKLTYALVTAALFFGYLLLRGVIWQGSTQLHTLMETVATVLALVVGVMALVHYYTKKLCVYLLTGVGFLGAGFLDGYHAFVTSSFFDLYFPSPPPSLISWSWIASRLYLSLFMWLSYLAWRREACKGSNVGNVGKRGEQVVYIGAAALTFATFLFFAITPLPRAYYPEFFLPRPQEIVPAALFLIALTGYLRKGAWKTSAFEHWLVLSLIVGFMSQAMFMSFSGRLFDMMFDAAHLLKKASYICVLTGLFMSMYSVFSEERKLVSESERQRADIDRSLRELQISHDSFNAFMDHSPMVAWAKDEQLRFIYINAPFERSFNCSLSAIQGRTDFDLFPEVVAKQNQENDRRVMESAKQIEIIEAVPTPEGLMRFWLVIKFPYPLGEGRIGVGGVAVDITERREHELKLKELSAAVEQSPVSIVITDRNGTIEYVNPQFERISGYRADEAIGKNPRILKSGHTKPEEYDALWRTITSGKTWHGRFLNVRKDGSQYWEESSISPIMNEEGEITAYVAVKADITERKEHEDIIWKQANFDVLTGLANRALFHDRLERAVEQARRSSRKVGLLFVDLDGFKAVNDAMGHDVGDALLIATASRLKQSVRKADTVARLGGDEFVILLIDLKNADDLNMIGGKILNVLRQPYEICGSTLDMSGSIGAAVFPDDGDDEQALTRNADLAMYEAKRAGRNCLRFYTPALG